MSASMRHVVVATDERFALPTAVTLRSLALHDSGPLTVWILYTDVSAASRERVAGSLPISDVRLEWVDMQAADVGDTSQSRLGRASFFRLAIGEALPKSVNSVLYLDTDILVTDSLQPLWTLPDRGETAGAVRSVHFPSMCTYGAMDHWPELGLDPRAPYFNSGLLMVRLDRWRASNIGRRAFAHLESPFANGALADQEALNVVLSGHWTELEPRWNQQTPFLEKNRGVELLYEDSVIQAARQHPAIIHFLNRPKPWHSACRHPARDAWRATANATAFAPVNLEFDSVLDQARRRIRRAASALFKGR